MKQLLIVFLILAGSSSLFPLTLEYKYEKNQPIIYQLVMDNASSFTSPDSGERKLTMQTRIKMKQELIEEDAEGVMKVAMTILDAVQVIDGVEKPFPSAVNQTQIIRMRKNGKLLSTLTQLPGQSPDQNSMQMVFPEGNLAVGDTWTQIKDIAQPIPVETKTLYKITRQDGDKVTISSIMRLKNSKGDSVSAESKGNSDFDVVKGRITSAFSDSEFQFEIPLKVPGLIPNNSNVKVTMRMKVKLSELNEVKGAEK